MKTILSILGLCLALNLQAQSLTDSLLLYYRFDGNALDCSGNNFHGTASGVTDTLDRFGNSNSAYYFDGVNNYIDLPNVADLKPTDFPVTFSFWVKVEAYGVQNSAFFSTDFQQNNYHGYWMNLGLSGFAGCGFGGGAGGCGPSNKRVKNASIHIEIGSWTHVAGIIRSATDISIIYNCLDIGGNYNGTGNTNVAYTSTPGRIGAMDASTSNSAHYYWGFMDEFAFWDRELSTAEILSICNGALQCVDTTSNDTTGNPIDTTSSIYLNTKVDNGLFELHLRDNQTSLSCHSNGTLEIITLTGQRSYQKRVKQNDKILLNALLKRGVYIVRMTNEKGDQFIEKTIIY